MSVLTLKGEEIKTFPTILRDYASYLVVIKGNSEKTVCEYLLDLRTFFRFMIMRNKDESLSRDEFEKISIKNIGVDDFNAVTAQNIIDFLMFAGFDLENNTTTRMRKLSSLKSFYHYAHGKKHLVDHNPTSDIDSPKKKKTLPKHLTVDEAVTLLETVKNDKDSKSNIRDFAIITLFLNTGMRLSELVNLNLESFDSDLQKVKVVGKGNKERIIYLNDAAIKALRDYIRIRLDPRFISTNENALFLSKRQTRISAKTVQWVVYKYLDMAGLGAKGLSVHKLRHTAATLMYQTGKVDIRVLKEILGHEQLNTTQIYTHVVDKNIEEAMNKNPLAEIKFKRKTREILDD
jgi:site-specific recombinase XerD